MATITPEVARRELARRELARRAQTRLSREEVPRPSATQHPLASLPGWQALVSRPAAQYRGFVRGLTPGGESPLEGFRRGALAEGEELVQRAQPFDIHGPMLNRFNARLPLPKTPLDILTQTLAGIQPSTQGLILETAANVATNPIEALTALLPLSRVGQGVGRGIAASK